MEKKTENTCVCLLSSFQEKEKKELGEDIKKLPGGVYIETSFYQSNCNVVICKVPSRGEKYLCGSAAGKPLLTPTYIKDCLKAGKWLKVDSYEWCNQAVHAGMDEKILSLPNRCKQYMVKNNGKLIFSDWKVLLHITEKTKRNAYKRLLESGGAKIINASPPFLIGLRYKVTHIFATKESSVDLKVLQRDKFENIFYPEYIAEYLIQPISPKSKNFQPFTSENKNMNTKKIMNNKAAVKIQSPRKSSIPPHKMIGQKTIFEMFNRKRKSLESSPSPKRKCLQNMSTPNNPVRIKTESPYFSPTGLKLKESTFSENLLINGITPISHETAADDEILSNLCLDGVKGKLFSKKKPTDTLHKQALTTNLRSKEIINLLSDDDDSIVDGHGLKRFTSNAPQKNCSTILIDSTISMRSDIEIGEDLKNENSSENSIFLNFQKGTPVAKTTEQLDLQPSLCSNNSITNEDLPSYFDNTPSVCVTVKTPVVLNVHDESASEKEDFANQPADLLSSESNRSCRGRIRKAKCYSDYVLSTKKKIMKTKTTESSFVTDEISTSLVSSRSFENNSLILPYKSVNYTCKSDESFCIDSHLDLDETNAGKKVTNLKTPHSSLLMDRSSTSAMSLRNSDSSILPHKLMNDTTNSVESFNNLDQSSTRSSLRCKIVKNSTNPIMKIVDCQKKKLIVTEKEHVILHYPSVNTLYFPFVNLFIKRMSFSRRLENTIESNVEEKNFEAAFIVIKDNTSSFQYPSPKIISLLLQATTNQKLLGKGSERICLLQNVNIWHPVKEIASVYNHAFELPSEQKDGSLVATCSSWEYFMQLVSNVSHALDGDAVAARSKYVTLNLLVIEYIVAILEKEIKNLESLCFSSTQKSNMDALRKSLLWQLLWRNGFDCSINNNVKELVHYAMNLAVKPLCQEGFRLSQLLITLLSQVAQCISLKDKLQTDSYFASSCSHMVSHIETKYLEVFTDDIPESSKFWFLTQLQPCWLSYRLLDFILLRYNTSLVKERHKELLNKPLSLNKIIYCYFFLCPKVERKVWKKKMTTPLKDIKNNVQPGSRTPSLGYITRKNAKGETPLQVACIKNNPSKVKELLALGASPNVKDNAGWSPLHEACNFGHLKCLEQLLKSKDLNIYATGPDGVSALHDAAENDHIKVVERLLRKGGRKLLHLKTHSDKTVFDFVHTTGMKTMLDRYKNTSTEDTINTSVSSNEDLDNGLYRRVGKVSSHAMEEYLQLLKLLICSFTSTEDNYINEGALKTQHRLFKEHVQRLHADTSLKVKLWMRSIERALSVH